MRCRRPRHPCAKSHGRDPLTRLLFLLLLLAAGPLHAQGQPSWSLGPGVGDSLRAVWEQSLSLRREGVACLAGSIAPDTIRITLVQSLVSTAADSLTADAEQSLVACGPPRWIGTVHSHVRSTDSELSVNRFSPGDRAVMSAWRSRWGRRGAFCVVYSESGMHCEIWPPAARSEEREPDR